MKKAILLFLLINSLGYGVQLKEGYNHQYIVKNGDNLYKISRKFNLSMESLIKINSIENPDLIYAGDRLKVNSELVELGKKYEILGNDIWKSKDIDLEDKISKSLNSYRIAKQFYKKSGVLYGIEIELKILKLDYLKEALRLERVGDIFYTKDQRVKATEKYEEMLKRLDLYLDLERKDEKSILAKIERVEKILGHYVENNNMDRGKVTLVSFIDRNNNNTLDLDDILLAEESVEVTDRRIKENNINIEEVGEKVFIPIKTDIISLSGGIRLVNELPYSQKSDIYENLLLRIKNHEGEEIAILPVDRNGNFYIDKIVQGEYYYDIEEITDLGIKPLESNKKIEINSNDVLLKLKV